MSNATASPVQWQWVPFGALTTQQLYEVLQLRSEVFVVEQNCLFQDMDGLDDRAMHLLGTQDCDGVQVLVAYVRCFPAGVTFPQASIGRVVTRQSARNGGLGHRLMQEAIAALHTTWGTQAIRIGAQAHLKNFYLQHGFVDVNKPYLEDGIPHLEMVRQD